MKLQLMGCGGDILASLVIVDRATQVRVGKPNGSQALGDRQVEYPLYLGPDGVQSARSNAFGWDIRFLDEMSIGLDDYGVRWPAQIDNWKRLSPPPAEAASERIAIDRGVPLKRPLHRTWDIAATRSARDRCMLALRPTGKAFNYAKHFFEPAFE